MANVSPILYESNETTFVSNGLGRLRDCISCKVTEERNGIFECDFEYPVDGANYDLIQCGRIIGVTHDETGDVEPFDIVSYSKPISGVVSFHAVHISYRQRGIVARGTNINSLADAFAVLTSSAQPSNPFTYSADFTSSAYASSFDGTPRSVRQFLGGIEGSILDAYGGEYEFDRFRVILHQSRGQLRDFVIRYGVNLLDYKDDTDYSETYTSCVPYWHGNDNGSDTTVIGNRVDLGGTAYNGQNICAALDLSDKFEDKPTTAQLESLALSLMQSRQTQLPAQNINVDFVRIQDLEDFGGLGSLMQCNLCDSIKVEFPRYGMSGTYKIVKVVWDVLADKYQSMELGALSTSLSEALGIVNSPSGSASGGGAPSDLLEWVVGYGVSGIWTYRKWNSGKYDAWYDGTINMLAGSAWLGGYFHASSSGINPPSFSTSVTSFYGATTGAVLYVYCGRNTSTNQTYWLNASSAAANNISVHLEMHGTWQ